MDVISLSLNGHQKVKLYNDLIFLLIKWLQNNYDGNIVGGI